MKSDKIDAVPVKSSEITPEHVYLSRRQFMKAAGAAVGTVAAGALLAACQPFTSAASVPTNTPGPAVTSIPITPLPTLNDQSDELGAALTSYEDITNYNNYYEFTTDKAGVNPLSQNFRTSPWQVEVSGLVQNPKTYAVEDLINKYTQEEHIYRLRCVEAWSMVIPWVGFHLSDLLKDADPMTSAKYVRFTTIFDPSQMPGQKDGSYPWPYTEGLRLDEAMNQLTLLGTGMYGKLLPPEDGAPIRLVVPWKYGFKSIKAIIRIELVEQQPATFWNTIASNEYGFYSNVNPQVDHPRWSQKSERRIGEAGRISTLMFNGYGNEVASLYAGMDLRKNY